MSGSFGGASQSPSHIEPTSSLLFSPFSRLKLRPRSLSATMIITSSVGVAAQEAEHALHREDTMKDSRHHSDDLSQVAPLLVDQWPQSHDHNLLRPNDDQTLNGNCLKGSGHCTCECKCQPETTRRQQQPPHQSSPLPLETGTMPVPIPKLTPASAPTTLLSISASQQLEARHGPRAASASAAALGSPLSDGAEGLEQHPRSNTPMGGTLSRRALQRTRTTDMLLSPTLTLARPSSVVLPPLPPITLKPPPVCSSVHLPVHR